MSGWIPMPPDLRAADTRDVFQGCLEGQSRQVVYSFIWDSLSVGDSPGRRSVEKFSGWGHSRSGEMLNRVRADWSRWNKASAPVTGRQQRQFDRAVQTRSSHGPDAVQSESVIPETYADSRTSHGPVTDRRARDLSYTGTGTPTEDNSVEQAEPVRPTEPDHLSDLWTQLQAIRAEHTPAARGQALTAKRRQNLAARLKDIKADGYGPDDLLKAARWVHTSDSPNAQGARATGDPLGTLLRPSKALDYVTKAALPAPAPSTTGNAQRETLARLWAAHRDVVRRCGSWSDAEAQLRATLPQNEAAAVVAGIQALGGHRACGEVTEQFVATAARKRAFADAVLARLQQPIAMRVAR